MKRYLMVLCIFIFLTMTMSCSHNTENKSGSELSIYIMDYDTIAKDAIEKFNETHKNVKINVSTFASASADELKRKLMYELNSGKGPDIILCEEDALPNLSTLFGKGLFYDLNIAIKDDKTFRQSDYFEKVLDYGVYKDKRYIIPLSFKISTLFTTKDLLANEANNLSEQGFAANEFLKLAEKYMAANSGKDKYFLSDLDFNSLIQTSSRSFCDLENKTASFDSKEFGDLLDNFKSLSEYVNPAITSASPTEKNNLLPAGKVVYQSGMAMGPRYVAEAYSAFKSEVEPVIVPFPYADKTRHIIAKPEKYIGVNSKCANTEAAYDFIKLMLSAEYQDIDIMEGIPLNRDAYKQEKEKCLKSKKGYDSWKKGGCKKTNTLKDLYSQLDELINGIDRCWTTDEYVLTIVQNELKNYMDSNSTKENTLKNIQQKVDGYLKSGFMTENAAEKSEEDVSDDPLKTVSLYYMANNECYVANSEYVFKEKYPDIKLKKKTFDSYESFYTGTGVELMAGGGPDIVIFQPRYFNSMSKTIDTGAFCEMDDYIKKYNILNFDEYNKKLLDGGVYKGKRYYIPLYYNYLPIISTKCLIEKNNIEIDEANWTWEKLAQYSKEFMSKNKGNNKYFLDPNFGFGRMVRSCESQLVDYTNRKSNFNSDSFKELLRLYKEIYPSIDPNEDYFENIVKNEKAVFVLGGGMGEATYFNLCYKDVVNFTGSELVVIPTPTLTGIRKEYVVPGDCIAVNSKCKNKEAAFNFIKIAASYDMQRGYDSRGKVNGNLLLSPVNNKAYRDDMQAYTASGSQPELLTEQMNNYHNLLEDCLIKDNSVFDTINELAKDYIDGNKTLEQVAEEADNKVNIFLNE